MAGTMTRDEMVTEICDTVGKSAAAASVSGATLQTRVRVYLNWAQKRIARFYSFHELNQEKTDAATVTDLKTYPMSSGTSNLGLTRPKDIATIRLIDSHNSRTLTRWSYRRFDRTFPRPENYTTGRPSIYARWGNNLILYRIANAVYTLSIKYPQWALDLTAASQRSDYDNKDQLLVTAGVMETYLALEEYADVAIWYPKFLGQLKDAVRAEGDVDWEPQAEPFGGFREYGSGEPWVDPFGGTEDPLYGYPG